MHVKRKVKVMLKELAKNGTDEDNNNLKTLIERTYKHPPNSDGSPLTADDIRGQSMTMEKLMKSSNVRDAGLETHHVLALRRGMKDLQITEEFIRTGGSEMACMSTTSDQKVAEEFALSKSPLLFKFVFKSFM